MKIFRILFFVSVSILLLLNCSKQEETKNQLKTVKLTKLHTITDSLKTEPTGFFVISFRTKTDTNNFLYNYNSITGSINVFDSKGEYYSNISGRGMGPEEIENFSEYYVYKDTVFIIDNLVKLKKFHKNGKYITTKIIERDKDLSGGSSPRILHQLNDSTLTAKLLQFKMEDKELLIRDGLALLDQNFRVRNILYKTKEINYTKQSKDLMWLIPYTAYTEDRIYLTFMSKSEYKINVFDYEGNEQMPIIRKYRRQRFSEQELTILREYSKKIKLTDEEFDKMYDYKVSIINIQTDKFGNLWVLRGEVGELVFDIFKDGELYSEFRVPLKIPYNSRAEMEVKISDRIYIIDYDENLFEVYDYEFK